ncbi:MAG: alanine racemase [Pseudoclavibacter sp.]
MSVDFRIPHSVRRVASISLDAVLSNLSALGGNGRAVDLRGDAYGHGLEIVAPALLEAGVRELVVSPGVDAHPTTTGLGRLLETHGARTIALDDEPAAAEAGAGVARDGVIGPELFGLGDRALLPAMRFTAEVIGLKRLRAGEGVSYGFTYRPATDTTLALIGVGYAHGAVRLASNRMRIRVGDGLHPIAGAISMDQFSVDLETGGEQRIGVQVGDDAVLFGDPRDGAPHVLDWAEQTGIPAPAITSRISSVVARVATRGGRVVERTSEPSVTTAALDLARLSVPTAPARPGATRIPADHLPDRAVARIDLAALRDNVSTLAATVAPAAAMLVVKSDAYGHDLLSCVHAGLEAGATSLGALEIGAGLALRNAGVRVPLFAWMHGTRADFRGAIERDVDLGVASAWQLEAIADAASRADRGLARVHLKIDTGLHRSGVNPEDWAGLVTRALELERAGRLRVVAAWSHLSDTSPHDDRRSLDRFEAAVAEARSLGADFEQLHIGASAAGIDYPDARYDAVRLGIAAYGISPFHDRTAAQLGLRPVMSLEARVLDARGDVAVIGAGYGDGLQSRRGAETAVLIAGHRYAVAEVGVDRSLVATAASGPVSVGDRVVIFGGADAPTAEEWAEHEDTVGDELVTGVTARVPRIATGA